MHYSGWKKAAVSVAFFFLLHQHAWAAFNVVPIRVTFSKDTKTASLTLTNTGDKPQTVQSDVQVWAQEDGEDRHTPTQDVIVSPPIFTIPAQGSQTIRVALFRDVDPGTELAYRLFLQEVPPAKLPKGISVLLRISMPIFVSPAAGDAPSLKWKLDTQAKKPVVIFVNSGNVHYQIREFTLKSPDGGAFAAWKGMVYVLPGRSLSVPIEVKQAKRQEALSLRAITDQNGASEIEVPPDK